LKSRHTRDLFVVRVDHGDLARPGFEPADLGYDLHPPEHFHARTAEIDGITAGTKRRRPFDDRGLEAIAVKPKRQRRTRDTSEIKMVFAFMFL
jgi:hypothetical protein